MPKKATETTTNSEYVMLDQIVDMLVERNDLTGWSVRHIQSTGAQLYAVPNAIEARRDVAKESFVVSVYRKTASPDGESAIGSSRITILPGEDIGAALDTASLMAGLIHNKPYRIPGSQTLPEVDMVDPSLQKDAAQTLDAFFAKLNNAVKEQQKAYPNIKMTAAECHSESVTVHFLNSQGIDTTQVETQFDAEWVLIGQGAEKQTESFVEMTRRRVSDLDVAAEVATQMQSTADLLIAQPAVDYEGPVVIRGGTLATMISGSLLTGSVIRVLADGGSKFSGISSWEVGKPIFQGEVLGDPLTVWANRQLPYGINTDRFDSEGLPAQRILLIENNILKTFIASQRYADYLNIPATGEFGNMELPAGKTPVAELLTEPYVEVVQFSWFNPDPVTGEFATEIRLGYIVEHGKRTPFKGGLLVGNMLDALANVRWSAETGFQGNYLGPTTARFGSLKVSGAS